MSMFTNISPTGTLLKPSLFEAKIEENSVTGNEPRFRTTILFTEEALRAREFATLWYRIVWEAQSAWGSKAEDAFSEMLLDPPWRTDLAARGYPGKYKVALDTSSPVPPAIFGQARGTDGKRMQITDRREIYSGVKVRLSLSVCSVGGPGTPWKPSMCFNLWSVLKLDDAPRMCAVPLAYLPSD